MRNLSKHILLLLPSTMAPSSCSSSSLDSLCFLLINILTKIIQASATILPNTNVQIPAVIFFGDSIVDPGNNNHLYTTVKCDFPPYGRDFIGAKPTGRFSNGKIPSDLLVELLGLKELLPAYLDPGLKPADLLTGVSFASGGAGYDPLTAELAAVLGLSYQLNLFEEYLGKLKVIAGEEKTSSIISNSLYLVIAGSDDIANTYFDSPVSLRRLKFDIPAYTDLMLQRASAFLQELWELGARKIGVYGVPPIGCVPSQRTLGGGKQRKCADQHNQAAMLFNSKLSSAIDNLNKKYQNLSTVYIDVYNPMLDIMDNPHRYGFEVVDTGCCGTGKIESGVLCNQLSLFTCLNVSKYVFWDSYHPTQRAYEVVVDSIFRNNLKIFF